MEKIKPEDFVEMIVAIGYSEEQRIINPEIFTKYFRDTYIHYNIGNRDDYSIVADAAFEKFCKMMEDGILVPINPDNKYGLQRISNKIDFKTIFEKNSANLAKMKEVFYGMYSDKWVYMPIAAEQKKETVK